MGPFMNVGAPDWQILQIRMKETNKETNLQQLHETEKAIIQNRPLHVVHVRCNQGAEQPSYLSSLCEKAAGIAIRSVVGAVTAGTLMASVKYLNGTSTNGGGVNDILLASAGLGVLSGFATESSNDAALCGLVLGGVATAAYGLTNGEEGALYNNFKGALDQANATKNDIAAWGKDAACALPGSGYLGCASPESEKPACPEGFAYCLTQEAYDNATNAAIQANLKDKVVLTTSDLEVCQRAVGGYRGAQDPCREILGMENRQVPTDGLHADNLGVQIDLNAFIENDAENQVVIILADNAGNQTNLNPVDQENT